MALVNPNIAMSFKPTTEYQPRNALAEYAQVQQIVGGQTQQETARMQLDKMKRDESAIDTMMQAITAKGGPSDPVVAADEMIKSKIPHFMDLGFKMHQAIRDNQDARAAMGLPPLPSYGTPQPTNALTPAPAASAAPVNALTPAPAAAPAAPVNAMAPVPAAGGMSMEEQRARTMLLSPNAGVREAGKVELTRLTTPQIVAPGGTMLINGRPVFTAPETTTPDIKQYEYAKREGYKGSLFDFKREMAMAGRTPAQPVAPTITQIVDPSNPNQMIAVDARRYQGGGAGAPGVIGIGGKEPGAALRTNKAEAGKTQLADDLANLRTSFQTLDEMRAIPSTERGVLSNLGSATQASGVGQLLGRAGGTEAQVERDVINSARMRLINSIKSATGMSAQQLNSNVELQTMLKSISDPGQSVQAAMRIIDDIENAYVNGAGELPKRKPSGGTPRAAAAPNVVVTPDGQSHTFPTPAAAAQFKKAAGL